MDQRIIVFDVETPNACNDRMSAIGLCEIVDGEITRDLYTLVNPETHFDAFNVALTGITPEMVSNQPTFDRLWLLLEPLLQGSLLVAHNATFDLTVLARCLRAYGIVWQQYVDYACTVQLSRKYMPGLPNHKLNTLSDALGLELQHHHAGSDARACGEVLLHCLRQGASLRQFRRLYDLDACRTCRR